MATPENRDAGLEESPAAEPSGEQGNVTSVGEDTEPADEVIPVTADSPLPATPLPFATALPAESSDPGTTEPAPYRKRPIYLDFDLLQLAAIFFLLDQLTKFLVRAYLPFGHSYPARGFFRFTHAENTGSAFGMFQGHNTPLIAVSFVGIFVLAMIYQSQPRPTNLLRLSLGLQIGGALGNLADRLRLGAVTDFIDVGDWPIFNLADASIISGLVLLGWILLRHGGREAATNAVAAAARDYSLKRRGRCARCGRFHSGRRGGCRVIGNWNGGRRVSRRLLRR